MKPGAPSYRSGFTLLEVLITLSFMMVLFSLAVPSARSVLDAFHLKQALNVVQGALDEARDSSTSLNRPIEVWICRSTASDSNHYRFIQVISHEPSGKLRALGRAVELPTGTCVASNTNWSSLMSRDPDPVSDRPRVGSLKTDYAYRQLTFYPSGTTNLASDGTKWFITVMNERSETLNALAKNFAAIQIDPVNGLTTTHQP